MLIMTLTLTICALVVACVVLYAMRSMTQRDLRTVERRLDVAERERDRAQAAADAMERTLGTERRDHRAALEAERTRADTAIEAQRRVAAGAAAVERRLSAGDTAGALVDALDAAEGR